MGKHMSVRLLSGSDATSAGPFAHSIEDIPPDVVRNRGVRYE